MMINRERLENLCGITSVSDLAKVLQVSRPTASLVLSGRGNPKLQAKMKALIANYQRTKARKYEQLARIAYATAIAVEAENEK